LAGAVGVAPGEEVAVKVLVVAVVGEQVPGDDLAGSRAITSLIEDLVPDELRTLVESLPSGRVAPPMTIVGSRRMAWPHLTGLIRGRGITGLRRSYRRTDSGRVCPVARITRYG
jgi:hypothetical protein